MAHPGRAVGVALVAIGVAMALFTFYVAYMECFWWAVHEQHMQITLTFGKWGPALGFLCLMAAIAIAFAKIGTDALRSSLPPAGPETTLSRPPTQAPVSPQPSPISSQYTQPTPPVIRPTTTEERSARPPVAPRPAPSPPRPRAEGAEERRPPAQPPRPTERREAPESPWRRFPPPPGPIREEELLLPRPPSEEGRLREERPRARAEEGESRETTEEVKLGLEEIMEMLRRRRRSRTGP